MGERLRSVDEGVHAVGPEPNWNESRYVDFFDTATSVGGWLRIGNRPNEGRAEVTVAVHLPGTTAFGFERATITANTLAAGGQAWDVVEPFVATRVRHDGEVLLLDDPWVLTDPGVAYRTAPRALAHFDLAVTSFGLGSVLGQDQDQQRQIFLPGQAAWHYQHLCRTRGTVTVGDRTFALDGLGGKDHSWGPRNWHAKQYFRWLIGMVDDRRGFLLTRGVGPTAQTRSGCIWRDGEFHMVDGFEMVNTYAGSPHHELRRTDLTIHAGGHTWRATGEPQGWLPLRHRQPDANGDEAVLRIVKSPTVWTIDGHAGAGMCEFHDLLAAGVPVGLHD